MNIFIYELVTQNTADSQHSLYQEIVLEETVDVATMPKCKRENWGIGKTSVER